MKILVRSRDREIDEFKSKFPSTRDIRFDTRNTLEIQPGEYDLIFDYFLDDSPENLDQYRDLDGLIVFCNSVKTTLAEFSLYLDHNFSFKMAGFNGMPTFFNRELLEISLMDVQDRPMVEKVCLSLGTDYVIVDDRVGMVTPRVICMIINEAYYAELDGTADRSSIDLAMKLGTNYPYGPFEWAERIGVNHVYELLEALYEDTKDERYKICPALKKEYILS